MKSTPTQFTGWSDKALIWFFMTLAFLLLLVGFLLQWKKPVKPEPPAAPPQVIYNPDATDDQYQLAVSWMKWKPDSDAQWDVSLRAKAYTVLDDQRLSVDEWIEVRDVWVLANRQAKAYGESSSGTPKVLNANDGGSGLKGVFDMMLEESNQRKVKAQRDYDKLSDEDKDLKGDRELKVIKELEETNKILRRRLDSND